MYEQCQRCNIWSDDTQLVNRAGSRELIRLCWECERDTNEENDNETPRASWVANSDL